MTTSEVQRSLWRLLAALSRCDVRVELEGMDGEQAVTAVRVVRSRGDAPDVLFRSAGDVWRKACDEGLVREVPGGGEITIAGRQRLTDHRRRERDGSCTAVVGAAGADAAERQATRPVENVAESPLAWLRRRRDRSGVSMVSDVQFDAGERLRADYERAGLMPRVTTNWCALGAGYSGAKGTVHAAVELREGALAARDRVNAALNAVGPELGNVLLDVCCHLKGLEQLEREAAWPQRSGKVVLQVALSALARHYGIDRTDGAAHRIRHWGSGDYRPTLDGCDSGRDRARGEGS